MEKATTDSYNSRIKLYTNYAKQEHFSPFLQEAPEEFVQQVLGWMVMVSSSAQPLSYESMRNYVSVIRSEGLLWREACAIRGEHAELKKMFLAYKKCHDTPQRRAFPVTIRKLREIVAQCPPDEG